MSARFEGDIAFSVEDASGSVGGRIEASADRVRITTGQPGRLWSVAGDLLAALPADALPAGLREGRGGLRGLAESLAAEGVTVEINSLAGPLVTIGADVDSRLGALTAGSRRVEPHRRAALPGSPAVPGRSAVAARTAAAGFAALAVFAVGFAARGWAGRRPR